MPRIRTTDLRQTARRHWATSVKARTLALDLHAAGRFVAARLAHAAADRHSRAAGRLTRALVKRDPTRSL
jgi:hypothetical protein